MQTRCPYCQTRFRVTPTQLKLRAGKVRCGVCDEVFDALDALGDEAPTTGLAPQAPSLPDTARVFNVPEVPVHTEESAPRGLPDYVRELPEEFLPPTQTSPDTATNYMAAGQTTPVTEPEADPAPSSEEERIPEKWRLIEEPPPPPSPRKWPWILGIVVLTLFAGAHLLYIFRSDLAVRAPGMRPFLVEGCALLGCTVPLPLQPDHASIESSDLVPEGDTLLLTAQLRNRARFALDYPHLELTLTGPRDEALVRKVLTPADYLPADRDPAQGFKPRSSVDIRLHLVADGLTAIGYRLYLFNP